MFTSLLYAINTPERRRYPFWVRVRNNIPLLYFIWSTTWE